MEQLATFWANIQILFPRRHIGKIIYWTFFSAVLSQYCELSNSPTSPLRSILSYFDDGLPYHGKSFYLISFQQFLWLDGVRRQRKHAAHSFKHVKTTVFSHMSMKENEGALNGQSATSCFLIVSPVWIPIGSLSLFFCFFLQFLAGSFPFFEQSFFLTWLFHFYQIWFHPICFKRITATANKQINRVPSSLHNFLHSLRLERTKQKTKNRSGLEWDIKSCIFGHQGRHYVFFNLLIENYQKVFIKQFQ